MISKLKKAINPIQKYFDENPKTKKQVKTLLEYAILIFIFFCLRSSVFGNYRIPTGSMIPTLKVGDHLFANKLAYSLKVPFTKNHIIRWGTPQRGDIVSFKYPIDEKLDYTKRVIGVPGDRIALKDKHIILNGVELPWVYVGKETDPETKIEYFLYEEDLAGIKHMVRVIPNYISDYDNHDEFTIPENLYFCMGDNRDNSSDSRVWGFVPLENFDGRLGFRWIHIETRQLSPEELETAGALKYIPRIKRVSFEGFGIL